jgi:hypothetical protein
LPAFEVIEERAPSESREESLSPSRERIDSRPRITINNKEENVVEAQKKQMDELKVPEQNMSAASPGKGEESHSPVPSVGSARFDNFKKGDGRKPSKQFEDNTSIKSDNPMKARRITKKSFLKRKLEQHRRESSQQHISDPDGNSMNSELGLTPMKPKQSASVERPVESDALVKSALVRSNKAPPLVRASAQSDNFLKPGGDVLSTRPSKMSNISGLEEGKANKEEAAPVVVVVKKKKEEPPEYRGGVFTKFGRRGKPQERIISVSDDNKRLEWRGMNATKPSNAILIKEIKDIRRGRNTPNFKKFPGSESENARSFSLLTKTRSVDLMAGEDQEELLEGFLTCLNKLMANLKPKPAPVVVKTTLEEELKGEMEND